MGSSPAKKGKRARRFSFWCEIREEVGRIAWTPREVLCSLTRVVVSSVFISGLGIYLVDLLINGILGGVGVLAKGAG